MIRTASCFDVPYNTLQPRRYLAHDGIVKVFNAAEMRIKGTELEKFAKTKGRLGAGGSRNGGRGAGGHRGGKAATARGFDDTPVGGGGGGGAKSSKWRQQSKQFRDALRQVCLSLLFFRHHFCSPWYSWKDHHRWSDTRMHVL